MLNKKLILKNSLKSFVVFLASSVVFVIFITIFPLIGSLTINDFPIYQVIKDNFKLLIPLSIVSLLISPILGWASSKITKKRFLFLFLFGFCACLIAIFAVMIMYMNANFSDLNINDFFSMMFLSIWGLIAYSLFTVPVLIPSILLIEKWTRM